MKLVRLVGPVLVVLAAAPLALAQDTILSPPKNRAPPAAARPRAPLPPKAAPAPAREQHPHAKAAQAMASIATRESSCLREAAQQVGLAAERLDAAGPPALVKQRREELEFHVGVMEECHNIARQRRAQVGDGMFDAYDSAGGAPEVQKRARALFGFGKIQVESGKARADVVAAPLRRHAARYQRCYDRALSRVPDLEGTLKLRMRMTPGGDGARPTTVAIPAGPGDASLHRCLASALMETRFPHSLAGSDVSLEMAFAPTRAAQAAPELELTR
jgi:hypothetical protein